MARQKKDKARQQAKVEQWRDRKIETLRMRVGDVLAHPMNPKLHPDTQFDIQAGGAGKGMTDTLAGAVDIGMVSRDIKPEETARGAYWVPVAKDAARPSPRTSRRTCNFIDRSIARCGSSV